MESKNTTTFEEKDYDVSINFCLWLSLVVFHYGFAPYSTKLHLGKEDITRCEKNLCGSSESKNPYGELGNVSRGNCCCFVSVESSIAALGSISPGCGCDSQAVNEIMNELKARQTGRGDTAQIKRAEQTLERLDEIESKLDRIIDHLQIQRS